MAIVQLTRKKCYCDRILGDLQIGDLSLKTLELPWNDNKKDESCIPVGFYPLTKRFSFKYKNHLLVNNVEKRSMILIHVGNYPKDTHGCILIGDDVRDINADGKEEVVNSKAALKQLLDALKDEKNYLNISESYNV